MSYTSYEVRDTAVSGYEVKTTVFNAGKMAGEALVQIYVKCDSPYAPLHPRLCGFRHISLKPGEAGTVFVPIDPLTNTVVDPEGQRISVDRYTLYVGICQPDEESIEMTGAHPVIIKA